jgi:hypothetical protein
MKLRRLRLIVIHYNDSLPEYHHAPGGGAGDAQSRELPVRSVRIEEEGGIVEGRAGAVLSGR